jgi:hypothetical protein
VCLSTLVGVRHVVCTINQCQIAPTKYSNKINRHVRLIESKPTRQPPYRLSQLYFCKKTSENMKIHIIKNKDKDKAVPLQAWGGPDGSRKLRVPDFMTTTQDGGKVVSITHRPPLPPGNTPGTHSC